MRNARVLIVVGLATALLYSGTALAEINENNVIDQIVNTYRQNVAAWQGPIINAATWMFWTLALIEFTWTGAGLALKGADYGEVVGELISRILFIGFFAALLQFGPQWAQAIIYSLADIAGQASQAAGGAGNVGPGTAFDTGLELAGRMTDTVSFWDGTTALGIVLASLIVIIAFALITAMLVVTVVETYLAINAGIILLGFGSTRWTSGYAVKYLVYAFATGMKWFVLLLIVGLGQALLNQWLQQYQTNDTQVLLIVGSAVVLLALVHNLPNTIQSLLTGVSIQTGQAGVAAAQQTVTTASMASAAISRVTRGMTGVGRATWTAGQLARAQGRTGVAGVVSGAALNMAKSAQSQVLNRAAGSRHPGPPGSMGHQMTEEMKAKIAAIKSNSISK